MIDNPDCQLVEATPDKENEQMHLIAKMAAGLLTRHYPRHLWAVGWAPGGALIIKNMAADARYGYTVDVAGCATVSEIEKCVVTGGGEILERCGVPRGAWDGEFLEFKDKV